MTPRGWRLCGTNLTDAILAKATLYQAGLSDANLQGVWVNDYPLSLANSLKGATMSDGTEHG